MNLFLFASVRTLTHKPHFFLTKKSFALQYFSTPQNRDKSNHKEKGEELFSLLVIVPECR